MAVQDRPLGRAGARAGYRGGRGGLLEREGVFSWLMLAPALLFLLAFVAYPFCYGLYISLTDLSVGRPAQFVGLHNYIANFNDPGFWQVARNTFVYTAGATVLKLIGGLLLALIMNNQYRAKNAIRAAFLLPWIVPTVLSAIAWMWIFDPTFSVINWFLVNLGIMHKGPSWLADNTLAMVSVIIANVWRGIPFYGITLLAALQTIPADLYEAAGIDGASPSQRFRYVTIPFLRPVLAIVTMFSVIWTFSDFQLVYVLTGGGPANATNLFATYAFNVAMGAGQLGQGASIALSMFPPLLLVILGLTIYLRRSE